MEKLLHGQTATAKADGLVKDLVYARHGACQKVYTGEVFKDQILPNSA